jgi:hypothetical protein
LPGRVLDKIDDPRHGAYRVNRLEYIYARVENRHAHFGQARLAKAVAHVDELTTSILRSKEQENFFQQTPPSVASPPLASQG